MNIECVCKAGAMLGEGPVWSEALNAVLWVDIKGNRLHSHSLATGANRVWTLPEAISWVAERAGGGLIAGLARGFAFLDLDSLAIDLIGHPEPDCPENRFNDAKVDPQGRLWAGTMHDQATQATGALYCLHPDLSWQCRDRGYIVTNGPAFSPDGRILYHCSTTTGEVFRFDLNDGGALSNKRLFARLGREEGWPDGLAVDADGGLWVARWQGWGLSRYRPDGALDRKISLPVSQVTSMAFAGPDLDRLFVTSAAIGLSDAERRKQPEAGGLFELRPGCAGLPAGKFRG